MRKLITYGLMFIMVTACEKWYNTDEVSHISELPDIVLEGGDFVSFIRNDTLEYTDPGATAFSGHQCQRLGNKIEVRQLVRLPGIPGRRHQTGHGYHGGGQEGRGLRLRRRG